jgi:hypothetical protein
MRGESLAQVRSEYFYQKMNGSAQGVESQRDELANEVRDQVNTWEYVLTLSGILSVFSFFLCLFIAQNSFGLSKKYNF